MTVLITGGTGFLGAAVVRHLLAQGEEKPVVFHHTSASARRLADVSDQVDWFRGDVGNYSHVLEAVSQSRPKTLYHLAAMLSIPSDADPTTAVQANAMGTLYVLEAARLFEVEQVIFASTIGTYGFDIREETIDDFTVQRPGLVYGVTKVFGENLGRFYKRKYDLDFRGLRYNSVVGPGVTTPGMVQFTSWVIEESIKGNPFTIIYKPETRVPITYIKDAARATVKLAEAPKENIQMVNYLVDGVRPTPSAAELADAVRARVPNAQIDFQLDPDSQRLMDRFLRPLDDGKAREEWGWEPEYDLDRMVDDFVDELKRYPERYA